MRLSHILPLAAFVLVVTFFFWVFVFRPPVQVEELKGVIMPSFSLPLANNPNQHISNTDLQGQVTVINVFASWCTPCAEEMPLLQEMKDKGIDTMVGIAWRDKADVLQPWLKENGNPFRHVAIDADGKLVIALGLTGVPETYVVDQNQNIVFRHSGPLTRDIINNNILPLIKKLNHAD